MSKRRTVPAERIRTALPVDHLSPGTYTLNVRMFDRRGETESARNKAIRVIPGFVP